MFAAALILSTFGTGVDFGWQPMPDDSQRHEYVVQLEPDMLQALAAGEPVPIVSEVPDDAQPIGRIRITVGRGVLPRDGRVTRLKPAETAGREGAGIQLTQYTESTPSRYSTPPVATFDPYLQAPPATVAAAGAGESAGWNGGAAAEVADARGATGPLERVGQGLQEMTEPVRQGVAQVDDRIREAADSLGQGTQNLLDAIHPNRPGLIVSRGDQDAQAAAAAAAAAAVRAGGWNGGAATSEAPGWNGGDAAETPATTAPGWNGGQTAEAPAATPTGVTPVDAAPPGDDSRGSWNHDVASESAAGPAARLSLPAAQTPLAFPDAPPLVSGSNPVVRGADDDPWANVADERLRTGGRRTAGAGASQPMPPAESVVAGTPPPRTDAPAPQTGAAGPLVGGSSFPTITRGMLDEPAWRPFDGIDPGATASSPLAASPTSLITPAPSGTPSPANAAATQAAFPVAGGTPGAANQPTGTDARTRAAVILAWVLLTGSIAGNLYLFWSYLDVRTKYRALVRKTARAVGSRFSAA